MDSWRIIQSEAKVQLAARLKRQLVNCVGYEGDELANSRKQSYDYYFQRPRGDEQAGRSEIVSGDLSSMVEGNLAQMVEPLANRRIAEFCAYDQDDDEQAQLESDCVHEMLFKRQNGWLEVTASIKDALLIRNGVVKVFVDERTYTKNVKRTGVSAEIVPNVLDKIGSTEVHSYDPETGALSATVKKTTRKFRVQSIAPENFLLPKDWHTTDLAEIGFCAERHVDPRSDLIERGFPKNIVDALRRYTNTNQVATDARLPRAMAKDPIAMQIDKSQEKVEWFEAYIKMDDGEGASELHCVAFSDKYILDDDDSCDLICYALGTALINPHTFMGISLHDKLKAGQDSSTAMTRALMDNLNATTKNRTAHFDGVAEEQDINDGRTNGSIRVKPGVVPDVRMAVAAFQVPDTSGNIINGLEYMKRSRAEMGGASLDMATGQAQLTDRVGSLGLDRAYSVMEALAAFMTRMIANTLLRSMYLIAHETLRTQWQDPIQFKRGNQWVKTSPSDWPMREALTVNLGASVGERARLAAVLGQLLEKQAALAAAGMEGVLVDATAYYNAFLEWLRINDVPVPEKYIIDPRTPAAQQALKGKAMQRQQAQQKQDNFMNQAVALEQLRAALEKYKTDAELQFKYYDAVLDAQVEEAKLSVDGVVKLTDIRAKAQAAKGKADDDTGGKKAGSAKPEGKSVAGGSV